MEPDVSVAGIHREFERVAWQLAIQLHRLAQQDADETRSVEQARIRHEHRRAYIEQITRIPQGAPPETP